MIKLFRMNELFPVLTLQQVRWEFEISEDIATDRKSDFLPLFTRLLVLLTLPIWLCTIFLVCSFESKYVILTTSLGTVIPCSNSTCLPGVIGIYSRNSVVNLHSIHSENSSFLTILTILDSSIEVDGGTTGGAGGSDGADAYAIYFVDYGQTSTINCDEVL